MDRVISVADTVKDRLPLTHLAVWHHDHLCRLLDDNAGIRSTYAGFLTPGDVLTELHRVLQRDVVDVAALLHRHATKELLAEQWVRLSQAGSTRNERLELGRVAVDLDARRLETDKATRVLVVHHVLTVGDSILRPSRRSSVKAPHLVLVGGPGQGKTTLGQLMCQAYRVALLEKADNLGPEATTAVAALREHLTVVGLATPALKRWPLRVELSRYADALAGGEDTSLLRYLTTQINTRSNEVITSGQLHRWLGAWPWLLVLDGLDEIAAAHLRETVMERVSDFLIDAAAVDADLLVVATTRRPRLGGTSVA